MTTSDKGQNNQKVKAVASADCPKCGGFVRLAGQGELGERVRLEGHCPDGHLVFFLHTIPASPGGFR